MQPAPPLRLMGPFWPNLFFSAQAHPLLQCKDLWLENLGTKSGLKDFSTIFHDCTLSSLYLGRDTPHPTSPHPTTATTKLTPPKMVLTMLDGVGRCWMVLDGGVGRCWSGWVAVLDDVGRRWMVLDGAGWCFIVEVVVAAGT